MGSKKTIDVRTANWQRCRESADLFHAYVEEHIKIARLLALREVADSSASYEDSAAGAMGLKATIRRHVEKAERDLAGDEAAR